MDETKDRYASAAGWEPRDPYKKLREQARKEYESKPRYGQSMLEVRPASRWIIRPAEQKSRANLYGPLWREGEIAVLFGDKGIGKSFFAVQLAEDIATGHDTLVSIPGPRDNKPRLPKPNKRRKVLLFDFEQTAEQFTERYTFPSPIPGKLPCRTRFHFQRASINNFDELPKCFKNKVFDYLDYSISEAISRVEPDVLIIDSVKYMVPRRITPASMAGVLKKLKIHSIRLGISILITAQTPARKGSLSNAENLSSYYAAQVELASLADSILTLAPSSYGPDFRYVKLLAARSPIPPQFAPGSDEVLTYQLNRKVNSTLFDGSNPQLTINDSQLTNNNSSFSIPNSSFTYLGPSKQSDHHRDYSESSKSLNPVKSRAQLRTPSARNALISGILDGSYIRYLKS